MSGKGLPEAKCTLVYRIRRLPAVCACAGAPDPNTDALPFKGTPEFQINLSQPVSFRGKKKTFLMYPGAHLGSGDSGSAVVLVGNVVCAIHRETVTQVKRRQGLSTEGTHMKKLQDDVQSVATSVDSITECIAGANGGLGLSAVVLREHIQRYWTDKEFELPTSWPK